MGNEYKNQLHPQNLYQRSSFFPMLCRVSINDVRLSQYKDRSSSFSDEPSSPKVSCMGQVKRNNKVIGFPTPYRLVNNSAASSTNTTPSKTSTHHNHVKHTKLKKLFSSKNLTTATTTFKCGSNTSREIVIKRGDTRKRNTTRETDTGDGFWRPNLFPPSSKNGDCGNINGVVDQVDVSELDPPLPVIKKVQQPGGGRDEVNLWKRRFGGAAITGLQIKQIQLPNNNNCLPPTTV